VSDETKSLTPHDRREMLARNRALIAQIASRDGVTQSRVKARLMSAGHTLIPSQISDAGLHAVHDWLAAEWDTSTWTPDDDEPTLSAIPSYREPSVASLDLTEGHASVPRSSRPPSPGSAQAKLSRTVNGLVNRVAHREGIPTREVNVYLLRLGYPSRSEASEDQLRKQIDLLKTRLDNPEAAAPVLSTEAVAAIEVRRLRKLPTDVLTEVIRQLICGYET
jgi:hypothetical protein